MTIKFDVLTRFSGNVQFTANIDCSKDESPLVKLGLAVKWAIKHDVNLTGANLTGANLTGANLTGANLTWAKLTGADLKGADLKGANLTGANLTGANLTWANLKEANLTRANLKGADLKGANLTGADLKGADLKGANLTGADLTWANLKEANLKGANLKGADLRVFKSCLWNTLLQYPEEAYGVARALREGRVNGSVYSGECACLVGTIANLKGVQVETLPRNSSDLSERWFMMISKGDTPNDDTGGGFAAKMALGWVEEFIALRFPESEAA